MQLCYTLHWPHLVGRAVAVIVIGVVKPVACPKKQASQNENRGERQQNGFNIHSF